MSTKAIKPNNTFGKHLTTEIPIHIDENKTPLVPWLKANQSRVEETLTSSGGLLLRGFEEGPAEQAEQVLSILGHELLDDAFWSTPRSGVSKKTFTATEYPNEKTIALHSEMAYMPVWPRLVAFHSIDVADEGGETSICDIDKFSDAISDLLPEFLNRGVLYKRTYHPNIDIPWQKAFQTIDPKRVKTIAGKFGMEVNWLSENELQTTHKLQGCILSEDDKPLWFNQAHIFHTANLPDKTLSQLIDVFGEDYLPRSSFYGDGKAIPDKIIHRINTTLEEHTIKVPWERGDVLIIDNMRFFHGRMPFEGSRKLHVALANSQSSLKRNSIFSSQNKPKSMLKRLFSKA